MTEEPSTNPNHLLIVSEFKNSNQMFLPLKTPTSKHRRNHSLPIGIRRNLYIQIKEVPEKPTPTRSSWKRKRPCQQHAIWSGAAVAWTVTLSAGIGIMGV